MQCYGQEEHTGLEIASRGLLDAFQNTLMIWIWELGTYRDCASCNIRNACFLALTEPSLMHSRCRYCSTIAKEMQRIPCHSKHCMHRELLSR